MEIKDDPNLISSFDQPWRGILVKINANGRFVQKIGIQYRKQISMKFMWLLIYALQYVPFKFFWRSENSFDFK